MDGRSYTLLIAATLAASAFTGCIANPLEALRAEVEVSAFENKAAADDAALAWDPTAQLIGVITFELSETMDPRIETDPSVGNGLAPAWWYVYCATGTATAEAEKETDTGKETGIDAGKDAEPHAADGEERTEVAAVQAVRAFKVFADGTVESEDDAAMMAEGFDHDAEAIVEWQVDSDAMIESAKKDERFRKVAEGMNATVVEGVASHEGKTAFFASAMSVDGWIAAVLDAKTGEIIEIEEMTMDFEMPTFEYGATGPSAWMAEPIHLEAEGTSNAGDAMEEFPFTLVDTMHGELVIDYSMAFPTDGLHWAILDAEGELIAVDHLGGWQNGGEYATELEIDDPGDYTFVIGYMESLPMGPLPVGSPLGGAVEYAFTLDLFPGEREDEDRGEDESEG